MNALRLAIALLVLGAPFAARAGSIAEPIVFDFEDGLQGWELLGSAQRVQTQLLGGEWAIFGDGFFEPDFFPPNAGILTGAGMSMSIDLTDIGLITLEQIIVDGADAVPTLLAKTDPSAVIPFVIRRFLPLSASDATLAIDVSFPVEVGLLVGTTEIHIIWIEFLPRDSPLLVSFIDNITFHPVPEPSTLVLLGLAFLGMFTRQRR